LGACLPRNVLRVCKNSTLRERRKEEKGGKKFEQVETSV